MAETPQLKNYKFKINKRILLYTGQDYLHLAGHVINNSHLNYPI